MANNVLFKRGTQANLNSLTTYTAGAFYLTEDTNRLYFAQESNKLVNLNQFITSVDSMSQLSTAQGEVGDYFYVVDKNILCIKTAGGWKQINPDTVLVETLQHTTAENGTNKVTISSTVEDSVNHSSTGYHSFVGSNAVKVAGSTEKKTITYYDEELKQNVTKEIDVPVVTIDAKNTEYAVSTEAYDAAGVEPDGAKVVLTDTQDSNAKIDFKITGTDMVTVTNRANGEILVTGKKTDMVIDEFGFDDKGSLKLDISTNTGGKNDSKSIDPIIAYGEDGTDEAKFVNGKAVLSVYTKAQTDKKLANAFQAADAMTFKGVANSYPPVVKDESGKELPINCGDTFKAGFTKESSPKINIGDLIISTSPDGTASSDVQWEVIASGDDQTITGAELTNGIVVEDQSGEIIGINVAAGDSINVTSTFDEDTRTKTVTIAHADHLTGTAETAKTATTATTHQAKNTLTIPVVDAISLDKNGHVTSVSLQDYKVTDTHVDILGNPFDLTVTGNETVGTKHTATVGLVVETSDGDTDKKTFAFESDSLIIKEVSDNEGDVKASINLVWGSF